MKKLYFLFIISLISLTSQAQVVISQVYGGGGNAGAPYTNDFIEIFNRGSVAQDLTGWSVQYASAAGTTWAVTNLTSVILQPGQYFLIQQAAGATPSNPLPTPDATGTIAMAGASGKVILVNTTTAQTGADPTGSQIIDKVGYGTANGNETASMSALSNTTSGLRLLAGCTDTDNNSADFVTGAPNPRNTATTLNVCSSSPSIAISSPANAAIFSPITTAVNVSLSVSNFIVANPGSGDGHIHYRVNGGAVVMKYDTTPIALTGLTPGPYSVYVELVDDAHQPIVPAANATVNFTIASYTPVIDLAALRADVITNGVGKYYELSSNPVISYARPAANRNQKYIQDTSAGILIDDNTAVISTPMVIGDAISGLKGQTSLFNGVLQLLPTENATIASSGNIITPQIVTAANITANIEAYESELVQINNATFTTADGTIAFAVNTNYNFNDGTDIVFRTLFSEVDYIGQVVPQGAANRVVLVAEFNGTAQVVARSLADVTLSSSSFNAIDGLTMYPNPLKGNTLYLTSTANAIMTVQIFDVLGKEVLKSNVINNTVNVSGLNAGVYIVKITEEGKTATRKLVIQ
jgi:hypothetical protein